MNAHTKLHERRRSLCFTVEQGCRRQGIHRWDDIRRYLLAATHTPQGRDLLLDAAEVEDYIAHRQQQIAHKHESPANRMAGRLLAARDRRLADAFTRLVESMPAAGGVS